MINVSIIMPAYNAEKYIGEAIQSVIAQTYNDWELIIVDDGSTDNTRDVIKSYTNQDSRIRYYYQVNGKQGRARNLGLSKAVGKFVGFLDADDLWIQDKLKRQVEILNENKSLTLICTTGLVLQDSGELNSGTWQTFGGAILSSETALPLFLKYNYILNSSVIINRTLVAEELFFETDSAVQNAEDYDLWLRLLEMGSAFYFLNVPLTIYRVHLNQSTSRDSYASRQMFYVLIKRKYNNKKIEEIRLNSALNYMRLSTMRGGELSKKEIIEMLKLYSQSSQTFFFTLILKFVILFVGHKAFRYIIKQRLH